MSILSDLDILECLNGKVVIVPFRRSHLGNCSYDVTLGTNYYRSTLAKNFLYEPYNEKCIEDCWKLYEASSLQDISLQYRHKCPNIEDLNPPRDSLIIMLHPRETILAHTNEFIGGKENITTMMKARSSIGRNFIEICKCAGWGDVGYINRWTMEITNNSDYYIPLIVGSRIAQIVFMRTGEVSKTYESKYQTSDDMDKLIECWQPSGMLPKLYMDKY